MGLLAIPQKLKRELDRFLKKKDVIKDVVLFFKNLLLFFIIRRGKPI
jgi:hypothetical protein